jgi:serine/threonine-protein kinase HipA
MSSALTVLLAGEVVGTLERTRQNVLRLTYESDATSTGRTPVSLSLPLAARSWRGEPVERFLRALLPESTGALVAIERQHPGVDRHDPLSLLAAIGKDCPGAVQFCRPEEVESTIARVGTLEPQSDGQIEQRLAQLRIDEDASWTMPGEHWSLGGTQPKFALRRVEGEWFEAQGAQPTSHILKPGVHGMSSQALLEHLSMRAAAACEVDTARTEYLAVKSESAIAITRFDRRTEGTTLVRLHQEDLCQALGLAEKYEEHGGPTASHLIRLLRERSTTAAAARRNVDAFVDTLVFNTVIAAPDAHARNYAVLLDGDDVRLAPAFDISTSLAYDPPQRGRVLSMSIGGEFVADRIRREHWQRFADENRLDVERLVDFAGHVAETAPGAMLDALAEVDDWDGSASRLRERLEGPLGDLPRVTDAWAGTDGS